MVFSTFSFCCATPSILALSLLLFLLSFHSPSPLLCACRCSFCTRSLPCLSECECWLLACLSVWLTAPALQRNAWFCQCLSARPYLQNLILTASTVSVVSLHLAFPLLIWSSLFLFSPSTSSPLPFFVAWHCVSSFLFKRLQSHFLCLISWISWSCFYPVSFFFKTWWWLNHV